MAAGLTHRLSVGDEAPEFALKATWIEDGKRRKGVFRLSEFRGRPVAITFTMAAFTPV